MCTINPRNANFNDLTFDGDQRLITIQKIHSINDDNIESLNNGLVVSIYMNQM